MCEFCGSILSPENSSVRFVSKLKKSKSIKKLLLKQETGKQLSGREERRIKRYQDGLTKVLSCYLSIYVLIFTQRKKKEAVSSCGDRYNDDMHHMVSYYHDSNDYNISSSQFDACS